MLSIIRNEILRPSNATTQIKRFRAKINIQKPKAPHFERAKFLALTQMYFKKREPKPLYETCTKDKKFFQKNAEEEYPYERILANEMLAHFEKSKMIAFFHKNPFKAEDMLRARIMLKKHDMMMKGCGKHTLEMALKGTKYESVLDFYVCHNLMVFSPEVEIKKLLSVSKKFPQIILLAAIVDGRFISRTDLDKFGAIPSITAAQSELVHTLGSIGGGIVSQLNTRSNVLVSQLQERIKQLEEK